MLENTLLVVQILVLGWVFLRVIQRELEEAAERKAKRPRRFR